MERCCSSDISTIRHLLSYPISVCITLVSIVLESPTDGQAHSRTQHVSDFVEFLRGLQRDRILDVQGLLDLFCELESLAIDTISNAVNGTTSLGSQHLVCYITVANEHLVHGEVKGRVPDKHALTKRYSSNHCRMPTAKRAVCNSQRG